MFKPNQGCNNMHGAFDMQCGSLAYEASFKQMHPVALEKLDGHGKRGSTE